MSATLNLGTDGNWATKKDTLLAYNDENSNFKPLPFSFDRASSATRVNKDGLIETVGSGEPRIDFKDDSKGALLLEPSRSNLITYSENLNGSGWSNTGATITENQSISPDGSLNADLIELDSNLDRLAAVLGSTGGTYTFSFYIKAKEGESGVWRTRVNGDSTLWQNTQVNDTEWTRVTQTFTKTGSGNIVVYPAYRVDGTSTLFNAYIFGAQLEVGSYATSYIPTQGGAVTRVADTMPNYLNIRPLNIGNSYTLFLDADLNDFDNNKVFCEIENSNSSSSFSIRNIIGGIRVYNNLDASYPIGGQLSVNNKFAIRVDGNSYKLFVKGLSLIGSLGTARDIGEIKFYGHNTELKINNFTIDNTALSDAECEALVN